MKPLLLLDLSKLTLAERLKLYTDGYDTLTTRERLTHTPNARGRGESAYIPMPSVLAGAQAAPVR